jgi:hypothetical protein
VQANTGSSAPSRDQLEGAERFDLGRELGGHLAGVALHRPIALEPEPEEVVVLGDDLGAGSGEVERERRQVVAQVVDPEDQVLGQRLGVPPDDPADAGVHQPRTYQGETWMLD